MNKIIRLLLKPLEWLLILPIMAYRRFLSPLLPNSCRYQPSCSRYALDAIHQYGPLKGFYLGFRRVISCHPWGGEGYDPVPKHFRCQPRQTLFFDLHTHQLLPPSDYIKGLYNLPFGSEPLSCPYSIGLHPWQGAELTEEGFRWLEEGARQRACLAIGEVGLDTHSQVPMEQQLSYFARAVELAEQLGKPVVIHLVGAWDKLLALAKQHPRHSPWLIHGFRGKPALAEQLIAKGFFLSCNRFTPTESLRLAQRADVLLLETDDREESIEELYYLLADKLGLKVEELALDVRERLSRLGLLA